MNSVDPGKDPPPSLKDIKNFFSFLPKSSVFDGH